jgi:hypothetical protein
MYTHPPAPPPGQYNQGDVTHNGHALDSIAVARSAAYVDQVDRHLAALTVRETLRFAETCLGPSPVVSGVVRRMVDWEAESGVECTEEDEKVGCWAMWTGCWVLPVLVEGRPIRGPCPRASSSDFENFLLYQQADALLAHLIAGHHLLMSEYEMQVFGLAGAAETMVGDAMIRGIR